ncbi:uncharacterized protein LOC132717976 isoform X2 [Ruditapes philippinarum]|nr:uncharacterized protein LOC132717976 isoform X2 [Ruditapes philippinarum]
MKKCIIEESSFITNKTFTKQTMMQRSYDGVILIKYAGTNETKCIKCVTYISSRNRFPNAADGRHVKQTVNLMINEGNPCKPGNNHICNFLIHLETPTALSNTLHDTIESKALSYLLERTNGYPSQKCRFVSPNIQYEIKVTLTFQTDYENYAYECTSIASKYNEQRHKSTYKQHDKAHTDIKIPQIDLRVEDIVDDNKDEKDDSTYISYMRGLIIFIAPFNVLVFVIYICICFSRENSKKKVNILKAHGSVHGTKVQSKVEGFLSKNKYEPVIITGDKGDKTQLENQTIVLCINDSRLKDDIDNVLHKVKDYCKDNIIVIVIHFKQNDYFEYGDSEKKVKGLVAKIIDWDMRSDPVFDNKLTLSDLQVFLKSTFETKQCCTKPKCCKTLNSCNKSKKTGPCEC